MRAVTFILAVLAGSALADAPPESDFLIIEADRFCPPAYRLVSLSYAERNKTQLCAALQDWAIARLAGSASIGGAARNCEIYRADHRDLGLSLCVPLQDFSLIRGVLLGGGFRDPNELNTMSGEDWRNALLTELANRTAETSMKLAQMDNQELSGLGGLVVFLLRDQVVEPAALARMADSDIRQTVISDLNALTGQPIGVLNRLSNLDLLDLINRG